MGLKGNPYKPVVLKWERESADGRREVYVSGYVYDANLRTVTLGMAPLTTIATYPRFQFEARNLYDPTIVVEDNMLASLKKGQKLEDWVNEQAMVKLTVKPVQPGSTPVVTFVGRYYGIDMQGELPSRHKGPIIYIGLLPEEALTINFPKKSNKAERLQQRIKLGAGRSSGPRMMDAVLGINFDLEEVKRGIVNRRLNRKVFNIERMIFIP